MVEYVLGGSPTNKESPLSNMESRLRSLKFDENDKVSVCVLNTVCYIYLFANVLWVRAVRAQTHKRLH